MQLRVPRSRGTSFGDMAYHVEKGLGGKDEIVIDGFENGIAPSPHKGIGSIKNANINSLTGEVAVNYNRVNTLPVISGGALNGSTNLEYVFGSNPQLIVGSCIVPTGTSTITGLTVGNPYWVTSVTTYSTHQNIFVSASYGGANATIGTSGTATFDTFSPHKFVQGAIEYDTGNSDFIYYLCDTSGVVWANDPKVYGVFAPTGDVGGTSVASNITGFGVFQGVAYVFTTSQVYANFTQTLGVSANWGSRLYLNNPSGQTSTSHYALTIPDENGSLFYCDGSFVGQIKSLSSDTAGTSRFSSMKVSSNGATPSVLSVLNYTRGVVPGDGLPVSVYAVPGIALPSGVSTGTQYYVVSYSQSAGTFELATTPTGTGITISSGAAFYVTSFDPESSLTAMVDYLPIALQLPYYEVATCLAQTSVGSPILAVGTIGNNVYIMDPSSSVAAQAVLPLPESNTHRILNVDNMLYIFVGNKGNIYISNISVISGALTVPDYMANPYGTNQDPYFSWGDCMFLRGRVWFSIQDQNASNTTGYCGGIWSFTPTQNLFLGQDQGIQLHLENQNSYGTYNGVCDVLLPSETQTANGPQYWSTFSSDYSVPVYGIDFSGTNPYNGTQYAEIETDLVPVGEFLNLYTPANVEYKLSRPLVSGESVEILWRPDLTSAFTTLGTNSVTGNVSFVFPSNIQNVQWVQLQALMTSTTTTPSFLPVTQFRIRI